MSETESSQVDASKQPGSSENVAEKTSAVDTRRNSTQSAHEEQTSNGNEDITNKNDGLDGDDEIPQKPSSHSSRNVSNQIKKERQKFQRSAHDHDIPPDSTYSPLTRDIFISFILLRLENQKHPSLAACRRTISSFLTLDKNSAFRSDISLPYARGLVVIAQRLLTRADHVWAFEFSREVTAMERESDDLMQQIEALFFSLFAKEGMLSWPVIVGFMQTIACVTGLMVEKNISHKFPELMHWVLLRFDKLNLKKSETETSVHDWIFYNGGWSPAITLAEALLLSHYFPPVVILDFPPKYKPFESLQRMPFPQKDYFAIFPCLEPTMKQYKDVQIDTLASSAYQPNIEGTERKPFTSRRIDMPLSIFNDKAEYENYLKRKDPYKGLPKSVWNPTRQIDIDHFLCQSGNVWKNVFMDAMFAFDIIE
ncbi:uncharacterized protein [Watersipora subatra]|uniref:uncharacterized protein n=1 Tax=Watersipora subatra TaxID=2589382 RepID=UPI00355B6072